MTPEEALATVLARTGLGLPRGILGPEVRALAGALSGEGDVGALAASAAAAHWPELRGPMEAAVRRGRARAGAEDQEAFAVVLGWAADPDPDNPLARALAVRAASELAAAGERARGHLRAAESAVAEGGAGAAVAAAAAAGAIAVELLDLDPEDFGPEILAYVESGKAEEAVDALARSTGDAEIRGWAREAVASAEDPEAPAAAAGVRKLAEGRPPPDPAADLVWVPTILALAEEAIERALVEGSGGGAG